MWYCRAAGVGVNSILLRCQGLHSTPFSDDSYIPSSSQVRARASLLPPPAFGRCHLSRIFGRRAVVARPLSGRRADHPRFPHAEHDAECEVSCFMSCRCVARILHFRAAHRAAAQLDEETASRKRDAPRQLRSATSAVHGNVNAYWPSLLACTEPTFCFAGRGEVGDLVARLLPAPPGGRQTGARGRRVGARLRLAATASPRAPALFTD